MTFYGIDALGRKRMLAPDGTWGPAVSGPNIFQLCFMVDQRVNIIKTANLDEALAIEIPDRADYPDIASLRERVKAEYQRWHSKGA